MAPRAASTRRLQQTPKTHGPTRTDWTVDKIASQLSSFVGDVSAGHTRLVEFMLDEADLKAPEDAHLSPEDHFADMKPTLFENGVVPEPGTQTMAVKFKQHGVEGKSKGGTKRCTYPVVCVKTNKDAVPRYRFHHVEIRKNILTPNTMLNFVPHLRDVDPNSAEEKKYSNWLSELDKLDTQSGFKTQDRAQKFAKRKQNEYAATISMYLGPWLRKLDIAGCTKSTLIRYMASQPDDDAITPQQKSTILNTVSQDIGSPQAFQGARMFTEAFDRVFNDPNMSPRVSLRDILLLDKSVETVVDDKRAKDTPSSSKRRDEDMLPRIEAKLASYSVLGCLICFSHDCEHGEFDTENQRGTFSVEGTGGVIRALEGKWAAQIEAQKNSQQNGVATKVHHQPCRNDCYRNFDVGNMADAVEPWTESELDVLRSIFATIGYSTTLTAYCFVAAVLGRKCWDVYRKFKELDLHLPPVAPRPETKVKTVPWYDRKKKQLGPDWKDSTTSHLHAIRELSEPCHHDGPCSADNKACPCAQHGVLCERFCHCTAETCGLKFTGCACHSSGKTCLQRQKEGRPCICVQLNRECDPVLCKGCGARERADPENAYDDHLHSTGCQNVPLQRGASKTVLLGKSQLEGCGYGLFTAEDIAQDEFIIEYTGELITHDEGVRREARRGDVFDEASSSSYLFTLLEHEGIWVDAAIYGNLSRYINHAAEGGERGANILPKIMYVNHEYRIKFSALRDIKAGEELFFNYGDNFPNLTKKLLEENPGEAGDAKRKGSTRRGDTARKTTTKAGMKGGAKGKKFRADGDSSGEDDPLDWLGLDARNDDDDMADSYDETTPRRRKKQRGGRRPGAGRKKKQPVADGNQHELEIADSQGNTPDSSGLAETPTRRRQMKNDQRAGTAKQPAAPEPGVKKVSKRGGARPGAGRKPKNRHASAASSHLTTGTQSSSNGSLPNGKSCPSTDSEDVPLMSLVLSGRAASHGGVDGVDGSSGAVKSEDAKIDAAAAAAAATTVVSTSRKRKASDLESSSSGGGGGGDGDVEIMAGVLNKSSHAGNTAAPSMGGGDLLKGGGGGGGFPYHEEQFRPMDEDEDDEEEDDVVDRQARKRQRPLRYRNDER
ncbi:hypothetical protein QBC47DRAFT_301569 [Echria macrotheca]|uniref:Uncharacterized protein n=1 Tax=Echria macrotheca TaxID=438768 RepID=A0AAJ0F4W7_9PEZI|nr:hypothetical protein QBC47DRAFT_301569 [Echria macrotheca]